MSKFKQIKPTNVLDLSDYLASSKDQGTGDIVVHGPPKSGKTIFAATASSALRKIEKLPAPKPVELSDMMWLGIDAGAVDGFAELNLVLPQGNLIDVRKWLGSGRVSDQIRSLPDLIGFALEQRPTIDFIVIDTLSQFDKYLSGYYLELHKDNDNAFAPYKDIFNLHKIFHTSMNKFSKRLIWLCHSKSAMELGAKDTAAGANRKKASALPGNEPIQPDITGQARTVYVGNASLELFIHASVQPGKDKKQIKRCVYPYGAHGFEGSNRHHQSLEYEEPAHLGKLIDKVDRTKQARK